MSNTEQPEPVNEGKIRAWTKKHLTASQAISMMHSIIDIAGKAGKATGNLVSRLRNGKSPDDMLSEIDTALADNQAKIHPLAERSESLYKTIAQKKKAYESAPPARKKILELELRNLLADYKASERELTAFYDNEHSLSVVRGRVLELMAHGMRHIDEDTVDKLTDSIDAAADDAEGVRDSVRDLDKAGVRHERDSDAESFADALAGFDSDSTEEPRSTDAAPAAVETPHRKQQEPTRQESPGREPV